MLLTSYVTHRCVFEMHDVDYDYEYNSRQSVLTNILSIGCYHLPVCTCKIQDEEIPTDAKLAFFNETRHAYGRSALLLSGIAYSYQCHSPSFFVCEFSLPSPLLLPLFFLDVREIH